VNQIKDPAKYPSKVVQCPKGQGKALVATKDLPIGTIVQKFEGEVMKYSDVPKEMICHAIDVGEKKGDDKWIVSYTDAICANHSCDPNCVIDDHLNIVTIWPLKKGDELTFSYNLLDPDQKAEDFFWDPRWNFDCKCGAKNCQKKIDKNRHLVW
jgi:SET domain